MERSNIAKRVLIFIQNGLGGAEKISIEIAKMLISANWKVKFIICNFSKTTKENKLHKFLPDETNSELITVTSQIDFFIQLYRAIKNNRPNIVFSSAMHINQRLLVISPLFPKIKFIVRNDNYLTTLSPFKQTTLKYTYRLADAIISQTEEMEKELIAIGLDPNTITTLKNPINEINVREKANYQSPYPNSNDKIFVAVGRLSHQKGFDVLINAFKIVTNKITDSKLYIVGNTEYMEGEVYQQLKAQVCLLDIESKVIFTGFKENPYPYIKYSDVFVLSSRNEGLPNVLIEAQFLGKPCAATTCIPIISRIIQDGESGFLAENENAISLAKAMIKALKLKNVTSSYKAATTEDFQKLFQKVLK